MIVALVAAPAKPAERDLGHVISGRASLAEVVTPCAAVGYDIIAGKSGTGSLAALGRDRMAALCAELAALSRDYDRVVADLGAGLGDDVRRLAACAGEIIVVATDEPTSLTDAYAFIKVIAARNLGAVTSIVVNLAASERAGRKTYKALATACQRFLRIEPPLLGIVRRDATVPDAIRHQKATLTRHPTSNAAADVEEALDYLSRLKQLHQAYWTRRGKPGAFANEFFERFHRALIRERFATQSLTERQFKDLRPYKSCRRCAYRANGSDVDGARTRWTK